MHNFVISHCLYGDSLEFSTSKFKFPRNSTPYGPLTVTIQRSLLYKLTRLYYRCNLIVDTSIERYSLWSNSSRRSIAHAR